MLATKQLDCINSKANKEYISDKAYFYLNKWPISFS